MTLCCDVPKSEAWASIHCGFPEPYLSSSAPLPTRAAPIMERFLTVGLRVLIVLFLPFFSPHWGRASSVAKLKTGFYERTCPAAESIVRDAIRRGMTRDPRSAASVLRLQFHDCFVNGCDGSILLDDTPTAAGEKLALSNINSLRSFDVIDEAKAALEAACPGVVSCADVVIMAARDAVVLSGGPSWQVKLGRRDSRGASISDADRIMPSPRANFSSLTTLFHGFNLSITDLVALSGAHTIGDARCFSVLFRLYNQSGTGKPDPHMDQGLRARLDWQCPQKGDGNVTVGLDATPAVFDNRYFRDLVSKRGILNSDQTLFSDDEAMASIVRRFAKDEAAFFAAYVEGMLKLGDLLPGGDGEIRKNCRMVNS